MSKKKINCCPGCVMSTHFAYLWMRILLYFLHVCAYANNFKVHCGSAFIQTKNPTHDKVYDPYTPHS